MSPTRSRPPSTLVALGLSVGLGLGLGLGLAPAPRAATTSSAFDGRWVAEIPGQDGKCENPSFMSLVVAGTAISGELQAGPNRRAISGSLEADGGANFSIDRQWSGTMHFRGDHFEATWNNGCDRHAAGDRAPDDAQLAAMAAERLKRQDAYNELIRRAEAGDAIDYTQLRTWSVYARTWDFYDGKARGLLDQANAAYKGKDCAHALEILDQVIKLDFIIDSAHALRADCLRQAGEADKARIEDDIAKGLIHSLMDGWAGARAEAAASAASGGDSEETAYVVVTRREEMDVLANRHVQLKTRQTQIRGSNGRYYDLIHGVSIGAGDPVEAKPRDLYFDITSFVTGRSSRRAIQQVLAAQLQ